MGHPRLHDVVRDPAFAVERTRGTLTRLLMSPAPAWALLAGKGLACYTAILIVETSLAIIGAAFFGVRPGSPGPCSSSRCSMVPARGSSA